MINKVFLIGNLGSDPESRHTGSGATVTNFNLATTETWKNKDGGKETHTEWHKVQVWGKQAENCAQYLSKGSKVYVEGKIRTRKWQDRDGNDRYTTEIIASDVKFLTTKNSHDNSGSNRDNYGPPPSVGEEFPF